MLISVIVPNLNSQNTIFKCINSILDCKHKQSIEIIIVDDHSTDNSWKIYEELVKQYSNVKVIMNEGKGVSAARNTGISHSSGDVIGFCDSDDQYEAGAVDIAIHYFKKNNSLDVLVGSIRPVYGKWYDPLRIKYNKFESFHDKETYIKKSLINAAFMGSVCNKFYRRGLITGTIFDKDIGLCEDTHFNILLAQKKERINTITISSILYNYNKNTKNTTSNANLLFDKDDNLRYFMFLAKLKTDVKLTKEDYEYIRSAFCYLALDNYCKTDNARRKGKLRKIIFDNESYFIKYRSEYGLIRFWTHIRMLLAIRLRLV